MSLHRFHRVVARRAVLATLALCVTVTSVACGSVDGDAGDADAPTIAVSFPNYSRTPALQVEMRAAERRAAERGYRIVLDDPGQDIDKQVSTIRTWIPQQYDAIVAVALDATALEGIAAKVVESGTKWITYGSSLQNQSGEIDMQQEAAGATLGRLAADWFNEKHGGTGEVAILTYEEAEWARKRRESLEATLAAAAPGVRVVARQDALSETEGLDATKNILQAHPGLNGVLAISESASVGAYSALPDKYSADMYVGGMDGDREAIEAIAAGGAYRGSAALDLPALGEGLVTTAIDAAEGAESAVYRVTYVPVTAGSPELEQMQAVWK
ncbi:sugar ABC transporter substrate-binding protein [Nocardia higoensis]|uniref:sugar ABC transporter substrate-binding protein n=1 Tax=Nocardia higoensis TaxID=228599 RepID=UPI0002E0F1FE|nr:sugar ABC transporter substrate-binding protein [Nocardia higoensis]